MCNKGSGYGGRTKEEGQLKTNKQLKVVQHYYIRPDQSSYR